MPELQDLQALILLSLIPTTIAAMYSLVQVTEHIRSRGQQKPARTVREIHIAGRSPKRRL